MLESPSECAINASVISTACPAHFKKGFPYLALSTLAAAVLLLFLPTLSPALSAAERIEATGTLSVMVVAETVPKEAGWLLLVTPGCLEE